jgi:N-methylhydantoinase B
MGFQRIYRVLAENVTFATYGDRFRIAPEGVFGGSPGAKAETFVERGGQKIPLASKQQFTLQPDDRLVVRTGGGGGFGPPSDRAAALMETDEADGFTGNTGS